VFRVEIDFKPELSDVAKYCIATDEIFAKYNMPCIHRGDSSRIYGDTGNPRDIGVLYSAVANVSDVPWIVQGIRDAHFDNGRNRDTLMTNFFKGAS